MLLGIHTPAKQVKPTTLIHRPFSKSTPVIDVEVAPALPIAPQPAEVAAHPPFSCMYVYLTSGAVEVVPFCSTVTMTDRTVTLAGCNGPVIEYPRTSVYLVSREPISPPVLF